MQNRKNIILIAIVVVLFGVSGFVLYRGFGGSSASQTPASTTAQTPVASTAVEGTILPRGRQLDFTQIKKYNPDAKLFSYPEVVQEEVGVNLSDMIKQPAP